MKNGYCAGCREFHYLPSYYKVYCDDCGTLYQWLNKIEHDEKWIQWETEKIQSLKNKLNFIEQQPNKHIAKQIIFIKKQIQASQFNKEAYQTRLNKERSTYDQSNDIQLQDQTIWETCHHEEIQ